MHVEVELVWVLTIDAHLELWDGLSIVRWDDELSHSFEIKRGPLQRAGNSRC